MGEVIDVIRPLKNKNWGGVGCTTKHMVMSLCYKLWSFHSEPVSWHLLYDAHQNNKCSHVLFSSLAYRSDRNCSGNHLELGQKLKYFCCDPLPLDQNVLIFNFEIIRVFKK